MLSSRKKAEVPLKPFIEDIFNLFYLSSFAIELIMYMNTLS
jgi:hypothetical protein